MCKSSSSHEELTRKQQALTVIGTGPTKPDLEALKDKVVDLRDNLPMGKKERSALDLKDSAKTVQSSLAKLRSGPKSAVGEQLEKDFEDLVVRLDKASKNKDQAAIELEALALKALAAEAKLLTEDKDKLRVPRDDARMNWAEVWAVQVASASTEDTTGVAGMAKALRTAVDLTISSGNERDTARVVGALDLLAKSAKDQVTKDAASQVATALTQENQQRMKALGPSTQERDDAPRAPTEVLVQLLAALKKALSSDYGSATLKNVQFSTKALFVERAATVDATHDHLTDVAQQLKSGGYDDLATLCVKLGGQMPKKGTKLAKTRAHDNIYGRVFDSKFVDGLVKDPPEGVKDAMGSAGAMVVGILSSDRLGTRAKFVSDKIHEYLTDKDIRFWIEGCPGLVAVRDENDPVQRLEKLKAFLAKPPEDGVNVVAFSWALVKMSLALNNLGSEFAPWMAKANKNYGDVIMKQSGRENELIGEETRKTAAPILTEGAGITLAHQPSAVKEDWMIPSQRPTTINRPKIKDSSEAIDTALEHEATYASGVSGSTNIMLHLIAHMNEGKPKKDQVDTKDALLGTMMFLVYDGGHSMHEVMWTANQLDTTLGLGFGLGDSDKPNEFVGDTNQLIEMYKDDTSRKALRGVRDGAVDGVLGYFEEHSHYAPK